MSFKCIDIIMQTRPSNRHKRNTAQSMRDHEKIQKRLQSNGVMPDYISAFLEKTYGRYFTSASLLLLANNAVSKLNLSIDRLAKRNRQALLCWYAENWEKISPLISNSAFAHSLIHGNIDSDESNEERINLIEIEYNNPIDPRDISQLLNSH